MPRKRKAGDRLSGAVAVRRGSENVFADLDLPEPEERLAKAELARAIGVLLKGKTQVQAAALLGIDQPKVSALLRGKLKDFSTERLMHFLTLLGQDVEIRVKPAHAGRGAGHSQGHLLVVA